MGFLRDIARALGLVKKERGSVPAPEGVSKPTVLGADAGGVKSRALVLKEHGITVDPKPRKGKKLNPRANLSGVDPFSPTVLGG